jgi:hypothetical protein
LEISESITINEGLSLIDLEAIFFISLVFVRITDSFLRTKRPIMKNYLILIQTIFSYKAMNKLLTVILFLTINPLFAQSTFVKWIATAMDEYPIDIAHFRNSNDYLFIVQRNEEKSDSDQHVKASLENIIYLANENFEFMDSISISEIEGVFVIINGIIKSDPEQTILWGSGEDTLNGTQRLYLLWLDSSFNAIKDSLYSSPVPYLSMAGFTKTDLGTIVFMRSKPILATNDFTEVEYVLWEISTEGSEIMYKHDTLNSLVFVGINYLDAYGKYYITSQNKILIFDSDFNYSNEYPLNGDDFLFLQTEENITDSTYMVKADYFNTFHIDKDLDVCFFSLDGLANTTNFQSFGVSDTADRRGDLDFINTDTIFYTWSKNYSFGQIDSWVSVIKTDLSGNIYFEKYIGGYGKYAPPIIHATNDGGCIITASWWDFYSYPNQNQNDIIILKLDHSGNLSTNFKEYNERFNHILFYPNPGRNEIRINTNQSNLCIKLFNLNGDRLISQGISGNEIINTSNLPLGIYMFQITKGNIVLQSGKWMKQ